MSELVDSVQLCAQEETEPIFMGIFTMECITKIIASGLILHKGAYLHSIWNILDFIVVVSGCSQRSVHHESSNACRISAPLRCCRLRTRRAASTCAVCAPSAYCARSSSYLAFPVCRPVADPPMRLFRVPLHICLRAKVFACRALDHSRRSSVCAQVVVKAILCAMAPMMQIGVLILFAILIFAIIGLEFYSGVFHNACFKNNSRLY